MRSVGVVVAVLLGAGTNGCSSLGADSSPPAGDNAVTTTNPTRQDPAKAGDPTPAKADGGASDGGSAPEADAGTNEEPGALSKSYQHFDVNHLILTGQSNSVANGGSPYLTTAQPASNLMFNTGVMPMNQCNGDGCLGYETPTSFLPLVEGDRFFDYPVETPSSGIANGISNLAKARYGFGAAGAPAKEDVLMSVNGRSGNTLWCIRKGGCPYKDPNMVKPFDQAMLDVQNAKQIAATSNLTYVVRGVAIVHGESDHYGYAYNTPEFPMVGSDGTPAKVKDYADGLIELQADYDKGIKAISGQTQPVPLFVSQIALVEAET